MGIMANTVDGGENTAGFAVFLLTVFLGLCVILFLRWIRQEQNNQGNAKNEKSEKSKVSSTDASGKHHGKKEQANAVKASSSKKKLTDRMRSTRANEKEFRHPWLLTTFKGHTGRVMDMDFSPNGKYLVSCGDEDPDPGGRPISPPSSDNNSPNNSGSSSKEISPTPSSTPSPIMQKGLSRRQRKNRKRENHPQKEKEVPGKSEPQKVGKKSKKGNKGGDGAQRAIKCGLEARGRGLVLGGDRTIWEPLDEWKRMNMPEAMFVHILKDKYALSKEAMATLGYPLRPELGLHRRKLEFYQRVTSNHSIYYFDYYMVTKRQHSLDVHAEEFVPKNDSGDSGNGSSSSSEEESSSSGSEGAEESPKKGIPKLAPGTIKWKDARTHICARCGSFFYTTSKTYITTDKCLYHPGKIETMNGAYGPMNHSCCRRPNGSPGCDSAALHVWAGPKEPIVNSSFMETEPPKTKRPDNNYGVYSLDCEMSYTVTGLEVVKVTLVDITGRPVYNEYVKPNSKIVDFNTRFSGIAEEDFLKHTTKSLVQVQRDLMKYLSSETVLIGHGLENDLKGLKMIHKTIVDTAFTFPHFKGLPYKRSLKSLAQYCLNKQIQCGSNGHDSFEDARTCMELMLFRLRRDFPYIYR